MKDIKLEQKVLNTEFSIFMRQLHVLALLQHSTSSENMNYWTNVLNPYRWVYRDNFNKFYKE